MLCSVRCGAVWCRGQFRIQIDTFNKTVPNAACVKCPGGARLCKANKVVMQRGGQIELQALPGRLVSCRLHGFAEQPEPALPLSEQVCLPRRRLAGGFPALRDSACDMHLQLAHKAEIFKHIIVQAETKMCAEGYYGLGCTNCLDSHGPVDNTVLSCTLCPTTKLRTQPFSIEALLATAAAICGLA